ncbi:MAG: monoheme cytochrome c [Saliniramus fredricksonii]|uniref:Cytochrome c n=1 Tax=Saliniramus fredricksonii TaxID=1653334 RepID=A0A0P7YCT8_9HYPH|nr:cytochrome c family protein [Saliniramus fredricksonii]KPQ11957.1 MAG: monoheme cytochrome c [Saliniramus fredricksonii]SCC81548.1 cytochrome c [Saliniramus fredricksonii]
MRFLIAAAALPMIAFASPAVAQDAAAGQRVFNQCRACHMVGENARHTVGPHLNGLFGRVAGEIEGYNFSRAFDDIDKVWDEENFAVYIRNPREVTPGTRMVFAGLRNDQQIADLTAYLKQFNEDGTTD